MLLCVGVFAGSGCSGGSAGTAHSDPGPTLAHAVKVAKLWAPRFDQGLPGEPDPHTTASYVELDQKGSVAVVATALTHGWMFQVSLWKQCPGAPPGATGVCGRPNVYYLIVQGGHATPIGETHSGDGSLIGLRSGAWVDCRKLSHCTPEPYQSRPCPTCAYAKTIITVHLPHGRTVAVHPKADFQLPLPPGRYTLTAAPLAGMAAKPVTFTFPYPISRPGIFLHYG